MQRDKKNVLKKLFWAGFLFSLHAASTLYLNSSFLAERMSDASVGILYMLSSGLSLVGMTTLPGILRKVGSRGVVFGLILTSGLSLFGMTSNLPLAAIGACFVTYFSANTLLLLSIDILIEHSAETSFMGQTRGMYLTACNIGFMMAPLVAGFLTDRLGFIALYRVVLVLLIPVAIILVWKIPVLKQEESGGQKHILREYRKFFSSRDLRNVYLANFLLQFFYAWMVIYTPIYLHEHLHIAWDTIGLLFTMMLSAFVLLQTPLGKLADRFIGEKELMVIGFLCIGIATFLVGSPNMATYSLTTIALILFATRVGASTIEVATEAYFFKKISPSDTTSIGFFRNTYPIAYLLGPLIAAGLLNFIHIRSLFSILGILCLSGIFFALRIRDTK